MEPQGILAEELAEVMRLAYSKGLTTGGGGNASLRLAQGFLITPSGKFKGRLRGEDILVINEFGEVLLGEGVPSTEWRMHIMIYEARDDVNSVLHCHHPLLTAFASNFREHSLKDLKGFMTEEALILLREIRIAPWRPFGTQELAFLVSETLKESNAVLIEKHGAVVVAEDHWKALAAMESLVETIEIFLFSKILERLK
ncbi:MAG: class II aldolase/adducin family protein [Candidatus Korarchaeum sp.]|nr:class II aldolase/adducin family protein [Candidatus Korarchaeum sp.]MDW8035539.1 class II aldolase/adducin family protein [Candidatus Korarchaeum sp.]